MRVLIVSKALVSCTYRNKLSELARLGVDVVAVVPPVWKEAGSEQRLEPGGDEAYRLLVSPMRLNGHFHLHYYPELPSILRDVRPDLLHIDEEPYNLATFAAARAVRSARIPFAFFTYQNILRPYPWPFSWWERKVHLRAAGGMAATDSAARILRERGFTGPLAVVPQFGVDPDLFSPNAVRPERFRVGFLNRLIPAKAPLLTLDAFERLPADAELQVTGDGPLRAELELEASRRGLSERVTICPRVPSTEVPAVIRGLSVVVLPSLTTPRWKEQFGRILVESMACGVPVIGSDSGEIPEVVGDGGLIVPEGDSEALAEAMRRLYNDATLRSELGRRGRERTLKRYTNERVAQSTLDAYRLFLSH